MNQNGREPEPINRRLVIEIWSLSVGPISNQLGCVGLKEACSWRIAQIPSQELYLVIFNCGVLQQSSS